jgi:hypothetical protein
LNAQGLQRGWSAADHSSVPCSPFISSFFAIYIP